VEIRIQLNGESAELPEGATVHELLKRLGLEGQPAAVEINRVLVPRREHERRALAEGDRVEVVTLVGGG